MYRDSEKSSFNWMKVFLRVLIAFLLLLLCIKLVSIFISNQEFKKTETKLQENLKILDDIAKDYFKEDILPSHAGDTVKVYVRYLIETKVIEELIDEKGASCDYDKSFIQITRLDSEYQIKSYIDCSGNTDYSNNFLDIENSDITIKPATTTTTTKTTKTTKKKTTTKITTTVSTTTTTNVDYYTISFNTNGGNVLPNQTIKANSTIAYVTPTREGYEFIGWYYNGVKFNPSTKINKDYVLVAKWIKK